MKAYERLLKYVKVYTMSDPKSETVPSTMRQFQISPESFLFKDPTYIPKANEIKTVSGAVYQKRPDAILPAILSHYFAKRKAAKGDRKAVDTDMEFLIRKYEERFGKFE